MLIPYLLKQQAINPIKEIFLSLPKPRHGNNISEDNLFNFIKLLAPINVIFNIKYIDCNKDIKLLLSQINFAQDLVIYYGVDTPSFFKDIELIHAQFTQADIVYGMANISNNNTFFPVSIPYK